MAIMFQMLLRGVDGRTSCLRFLSSTVAGSLLQDYISTILRIPVGALLIVTGTRVIKPDTILFASGNGFFPSCSVLLRLRGGKGGFGSLLRGAATKAGQKKTSNFDACRDMSGRRLRHVNAEKKLKEWKAQAKERELEKAANEFLKKQVKQKKDESGCFQVIERFREETSRAREDVESAVAQGLMEAKKLGKRKIVDVSLPSTSFKRSHFLEIDMVDEDSEDDREGSEVEDADAEADSEGGNEGEDGNEGEEVEEDEDMEESSEDENRKEGLTDDKAEQGSEVARVDGQFVYEKAEVRSEDEKAEGRSEREKDEEKTEVKQVSNGVNDLLDQKIVPLAEVLEGVECHSLSTSVTADIDLQKLHSAVEGNREASPVFEDIDLKKPRSCFSDEKIELGTDALPTCGETTCNENGFHGKPTSMVMKDLLAQSNLNLGDYLNASELEVLGLERLKQELQMRGLKCGGSLAERAGRLFLLKTVPLEKLDKKHFAKARV